MEIHSGSPSEVGSKSDVGSTNDVGSKNDEGSANNVGSKIDLENTPKTKPEIGLGYLG